MSKLTLQSWLVQSERRMHFRCPEGLAVTQDEYLKTLQETAQELQLPLQLETVDIDWEDANLEQIRLRARLQSDERFGILTGLDYIGRVAFVEQKTYLDPLDPPKLDEPNTLPGILVGVVGVGAGLFLLMNAGSIDQMFCFAPLLIIGGAVVGIKMYQSAKSGPAKKLDEAVKEWVQDVVNLARRAEVSNELNNTAQALDEAVKTAVVRLFTQQGAEMETDERKRKTAADIQNEVTLRKEEFK